MEMSKRMEMSKLNILPKQICSLLKQNLKIKDIMGDENIKDFSRQNL
jgi:hypothetical protein